MKVTYPVKVAAGAVLGLGFFVLFYFPLPGLFDAIMVFAKPAILIFVCFCVWLFFPQRLMARKEAMGSNIKFYEQMAGDSDGLQFLVAGSKGGEYVVRFIRRGNNFGAYCSCPAGENGLYCRHRFALLDGDVSDMLSENYSDVKRIFSLLKGTDVEPIYKKYTELKAQSEAIKKDFDGIKKKLARAFYD